MYFITSIPKILMSKKKMKIRKEDQEYPNKPLDDAFMDRLYDKSNVSSSLLLIK